ncbi:hypothetical protein [Lentzea sp. NPDC059081]|uniref:hypothetical protein n=1 Tax=Lentzea sp. NPDC059081 TaxID=3346719 RepID=UPI00368C05A1
MSGPEIRNTASDAHMVIQARDIHGDINLITGVPVHTRYREQVRRIAPEQLQGRERELAELRVFCQSPQTRGQYWWWRAEAWSGKSALMSWFVLHPPERVRIVSFFVTARWASQNNRLAFIANVMEQLLAMLGETAPALLSEYTQETHLLSLFPKAAAACADRGEEFVLLVDGLDEDRGVTTGPDAHSIAQLLPARPPAGMRVIIAGRPNPPPPSDVPDGHPLQDLSTARPLEPWAHAGVVRADMERELKALLSDPSVGRDLLGLVVASGGGLAATDLAGLLIGWSAYEVDDHLRSVAGRSFTTRTSHYDSARPERYVLGHEELQLKAREMLGPDRLGAYRDRLHVWADGHRARQWPPDTPEYLLSGYGNMLAAEHDLSRLAALAADPARHECLLNASGGDVTALAEITAAQNLVLAQEDPDLPLLGRLEFHRDRLVNRNTNIPAAVPGLWQMLGRTERARALANSAPNVEKRNDALSRMAMASIAAHDFARGVELAAAISEDVFRHDVVQALVNQATAPSHIALVMRALATGVVLSGEDRNECILIAVKATASGLEDDLQDVISGLARGLPVPLFRLVVLKELLDRTGVGAGVDIVVEAAEAVRRDMDMTRGDLCDWLTSIAVVAAALGETAMALDLFDEALDRLLGDEQARLTGHLRSVALGMVGAEQWLFLWHPPLGWTNQPLKLVASRGGVRDLVERAVVVAESIADILEQTDTLARIASAVAEAGQVELAVEVAHHIADPCEAVRTLAKLPGVPAGAFNAPTEALNAVTDLGDRADAYFVAAAAVVKTGERERAEQLVDSAVDASLGQPMTERLLTRAAALAHTLRGEQGGLRVLHLLPTTLEGRSPHLALALYSGREAIAADDVQEGMRYVRQAVDIAKSEQEGLRDDLVWEIVRAATFNAQNDDLPDRHREDSFYGYVNGFRPGVLWIMTTPPAALVETILRAIRLVSSRRSQAEMLMALCRTLQACGHFDLGRGIIRTTLGVIEKVGNLLQQRTDLLRQMAAFAGRNGDGAMCEEIARAFPVAEVRNAALAVATSVSMSTGDVDRVVRIVSEFAGLSGDRRDEDLAELVRTLCHDVRIGWMPISGHVPGGRVPELSGPPSFRVLAEKVGGVRTGQMIAKCVEAALSISDVQVRGELVVLLAGAALESGDTTRAAQLLTLSESIARVSQDPAGSAHQIIAAVSAGSSRLVKHAWAVVRGVRAPQERAGMLAELAGAVDTDDLRVALIEDAVAEARMADRHERDRVLKRIVVAAVRCGAVLQAESATGVIVNPVDRAPALMSLAIAHLRTGNDVRARVLADQARRIVRNCCATDESSKLVAEVAEALMEAIGVLHDAGAHDQATEMLILIVRLASYPSSALGADAILKKAVLAALRTGNVDRAETLAHSMRTEEQRAAAERLVCQGMASAGEFDRAEEKALQITLANESDRAMRLLVEVLIDNGELNRAESVARSTATPAHRGPALCLVSKALGGSADRATGLLDLADAVIPEIVDEFDRSDAWSRAATAAFALGDVRRCVAYIGSARDLFVNVVGGRRSLVSTQVLKTLMAGISPDAHADVVGAIRELITSSTGMRVVADAWGPVPWLEKLVLNLKDSVGKYELLILMARKAKPPHARRLVARAMVTVPWSAFLGDLADGWPKVTEVVLSELEASVLTD